MISRDYIELAENLLQEHGLAKEGWRIKYDDSIRRFGQCQYKGKVISLSWKLCELNEVEQVKDTILHEIAHALVGSGNGHNWKWKSKAIEIGCNGKRCYGNEVIIPKAKYRAICPSCGAWSTRNRVPSRRVSCGACSNKFDETKILIYKLND